MFCCSLDKMRSVCGGGGEVMLVPSHPLQSAAGTHSRVPPVSSYPDVHTAGYHLREIWGDPLSTPSCRSNGVTVWQEREPHHSEVWRCCRGLPCSLCCCCPRATPERSLQASLGLGTSTLTSIPCLYWLLCGQVIKSAIGQLASGTVEL